MDLFSSLHDPNANLLPYDGIVQYYGVVWETEKSWTFYNTLMEEIAWENDIAVIFGKRIVTPRKVAWYGNHPFEYTYSNNTKLALPWTPTLLELKTVAEKVTGATYNSCLLNLYHHGKEGMAWHSDGEKDLLKDGAIASLSFGAERKFAFKHKQTKETVSMQLAHGSILVMKGTCQTHWLHRLPPTAKIQTPRINLTFRTITNY